VTRLAWSNQFVPAVLRVRQQSCDSITISICISSVYVASNVKWRSPS